MKGYFDPNDPPRLHVTVFPTRPDAILVRAVVAQEFWIPPLRPPLDCVSVAAAFAAHDIPVQVVTTSPDTIQRSQRGANATIVVAQSAEKEAQRGRFAAEEAEKKARRAQVAAEAAEKEARREQHTAEARLEGAKQKIAALKTALQEARMPPGPRVRIATSSATITDAQRRDELIRAQTKAHAELTQLNKLLNNPLLILTPTSLAEKQQRLADLRAVAQALARELRALKVRIVVKAVTKASEPDRTASQAATDLSRQRFIAIAETLLGVEMSNEIWSQLSQESTALESLKEDRS